MDVNYTIALDLEGTLITDAEQPIPRPGLFAFLEACRQLGRVVIYTMVDQDTSQEIIREMVAGGHAPGWFVDVEWVDWFSVDTAHKDLNLIPGSDAVHAFLVDDHTGFVHPDQLDRWIQVMFYESGDSEDRELELALWRLKRKIALQAGKDLELTFPGDPIWALCGMQDQIDELLHDNFELQAEKEKLIRAIHKLEKE